MKSRNFLSAIKISEEYLYHVPLDTTTLLYTSFAYKELGSYEKVMEIGERTVIDLGVHGLHPELIRLVGKMRFRSSYGQNLLQHSREVANLCAIMASELGLNSKIAKRAGLLHDIGKVSDEDPELSHALLGAKLCEKYGRLFLLSRNRR